MENNRKKYFGLRIKFILELILIGVCITSAIVFMGVRSYRTSIMRLYNDTAYQVAEAASNYFTDEELKKYAELTYRYNTEGTGQKEIAEVMESFRYKEIKEYLGDLRRSMNANDIYVCVFDVDVLENYDVEIDEKGEWNPLYYITDNYNEEDADFFLGDHGPILVEVIDDIIEAVKSGERPDNYIIGESSFGYNTSAVYPVVRNGETVACVGVEIPMSTLQEDTKRFIINSVAMAGIAAILLLIVSIAFLVKTLISPIVLVASEAENFIRNNNIISDKLDKIKTKDEIQILSENLLKLEIDINDYIENLTKVTAEKERIGAELNVATQIQADMLPSIFPAFPGRIEFDIYATMTPAKEVGGDFYDFFLVDDDHLAIVMADVSGKGVPAALFMVIAKTLIKNRSQMLNAEGKPYSPSEILAFVNEQLCEGNEAGLFVTVWLSILQISTGKAIASNAGHEYPAIRRAGGSYELIKTKNSPAVATMEGMRFREYEYELYPGDSLYVYTDGVPEATDSKNELFGTDRMLLALNEDPNSHADEMLTRIKDRIDYFVGDAPQFDDITMLCLNYYGEKGAPDA